jgi:cytochrome c-type biogenesis protein CcmE
LLPIFLFGRAIRAGTNLGVRHTEEAMDPSRKRRVRLVTALTIALLLAGALVYTTFSAASPERIPSQLSTAQSGQSYKLGGKVVAGSVKRTSDSMTFQVQDPKGPAKVNVSYTGSVPDPFREGREVIVTVQRDGDGFVGQRDSLVTKCPSKFQSDTQS